MITVANTSKKVPKGLASMIAKAVGCTPDYARQVLNGKHDDRSTDLVERIKRIAVNVDKELQSK